MAPSAREQLGFSEISWAPVLDALSRGLSRTAKTRQVIPTGPKKIGARAVAVPTIAPGVMPLAYGPDRTATPIHITFDLRIDDRHLEDESDFIRLVESAAEILGTYEDIEVIEGGAPGAPNVANRVPRDRALQRQRAQLNFIVAPASTRIGARAAPAGRDPGGEPTAPELVHAIATGMANLQRAGRPGHYGLLLHDRLSALLAVQPIPAAPPFVHQVEPIIGSNKIVGTSALSGTLRADETAGILLRLEPAAVDIVYTMLPQLTFLQRVAGDSDLRVEEEIVVRILDQAAVYHIAY